MTYGDIKAVLVKVLYTTERNIWPKDSLFHKQVDYLFFNIVEQVAEEVRTRITETYFR